MNAQHAGQIFKPGEVDGSRWTDSGQYGLGCARGAVNADAGLHHHLNHEVNLLFGGLLLHGNNHFSFPVSGADPGSPATDPCCSVGGAPVPWPMRAFLSEANSFLCSARITSMMRS